jgi:hypothetical protein
MNQTEKKYAAIMLTMMAISLFSLDLYGLTSFVVPIGFWKENFVGVVTHVGGLIIQDGYGNITAEGLIATFLGVGKDSGKTIYLELYPEELGITENHAYELNWITNAIVTTSDNSMDWTYSIAVEFNKLKIHEVSNPASINTITAKLVAINDDDTLRFENISGGTTEEVPGIITIIIMRDAHYIESKGALMIGGWYSLRCWNNTVLSITYLPDHLP